MKACGIKPEIEIEALTGERQELVQTTSTKALFNSNFDCSHSGLQRFPNNSKTTLASSKAETFFLRSWNILGQPLLLTSRYRQFYSYDWRCSFPYKKCYFSNHRLKYSCSLSQKINRRKVLLKIALLDRLVSRQEKRTFCYPCELISGFPFKICNKLFMSCLFVNGHLTTWNSLMARNKPSNWKNILPSCYWFIRNFSCNLHTLIHIMFHFFV